MYSVICFLFLLQNVQASDTTVTKSTDKTTIILHTPKRLIAGEQTAITFTIKTNLNNEWTGYVSLALQDEKNKQNVDGLFANLFPSQYFTVSEKDSSVLEFPIAVPQQFSHPVIVKAKLYQQKNATDSISIILLCKP